MYLIIRLMMAGMLPMLLTFALGINAAVGDDVQAPGPKVGESVPEFSLVDQSGEERTLKSIAGERPLVALVFYRSAGW